LGIKVFFEEKELLSNKYDIVFSSHVIEHVPNPKEMVNTVLRILKPGGIFVALSPNGSFKRREVDALKWMSNWGRKHPIYLDEKFFSSILGEMSYLITSRLTEADCEKWLQTEKALVCDLTGEELCVFAKKIR
jgi:2-polyprenyl-3-methyl-5-hydroxy-6-metoxy-1,4-benzoquinol methylase